jgi:hypothetical protein
MLPMIVFYCIRVFHNQLSGHPRAVIITKVFYHQSRAHEAAQGNGP